MTGQDGSIRFAEFADADFPDTLRIQVLSFLRIVWPDGFTGSNRFRDQITDPALDPYHLVYTAGTQLVSHLEIVATSVRVNEIPYRVQSLTSMLTYPAFRGEGWGGRLSAQAAERINQGGADAGVLFCRDELTDFYTRSGWSPVRTVQVVAGPEGQTWTPSDVLLVRTTSETTARFLHELQQHPLRIDGEW